MQKKRNKNYIIIFALIILVLAFFSTSNSIPTGKATEELDSIDDLYIASNANIRLKDISYQDTNRISFTIVNSGRVTVSKVIITFSGNKDTFQISEGNCEVQFGNLNLQPFETRIFSYSITENLGILNKITINPLFGEECITVQGKEKIIKFDTDEVTGITRPLPQISEPISSPECTENSDCEEGEICEAETCIEAISTPIGECQEGFVCINPEVTGERILRFSNCVTSGRRRRGPNPYDCPENKICYTENDRGVCKTSRFESTQSCQDTDVNLGALGEFLREGTGPLDPFYYLGQNRYVAGTLTFTTEAEIQQFQDTCLDSRILKEFYCSNNEKAAILISCRNECREGACIPGFSESENTGPCVVNGACEAQFGETITNCPLDCSVCGDGVISGNEVCDIGLDKTPFTTGCAGRRPRHCNEDVTLLAQANDDVFPDGLDCQSFDRGWDVVNDGNLLSCSNNCLLLDTKECRTLSAYQQGESIPVANILFSDCQEITKLEDLLPGQNCLYKENTPSGSDLFPYGVNSCGDIGSRWYGSLSCNSWCQTDFSQCNQCDLGFVAVYGICVPEDEVDCDILDAYWMREDGVTSKDKKIHAIRGSTISLIVELGNNCIDKPLTLTVKGYDGFTEKRVREFKEDGQYLLPHIRNTKIEVPWHIPYALYDQYNSNKKEELPEFYFIAQVGPYIRKHSFTLQLEQEGICGNEVPEQNFGETCDDGNQYDYDLCPSNCQTARCGDGFSLIGIEQCDDGNTINDICTNQCTWNYCGDGFVWEEREECDDGNIQNEDGCSNLCEEEFCGDSIRQRGLGEQCDLGEFNGVSDCSKECRLRIPSSCDDCGAGIINICDAQECFRTESAQCYFTNSPGISSNFCSDCTLSESCEEYGRDPTSCLTDRCGFGSCSWSRSDKNNRCVTCEDNDNDGFYSNNGCGTQYDCNDNDPSINPNAKEICDGIDNNCNGIFDEFSLRETCGIDIGACRAGFKYCTAGEWSSCINEIPPSKEICDSLDNDCDGLVDFSGSKTINNYACKDYPIECYESDFGNHAYTPGNINLYHEIPTDLGFNRLVHINLLEDECRIQNDFHQNVIGGSLFNFNTRGMVYEKSCDKFPTTFEEIARERDFPATHLDPGRYDPFELLTGNTIGSREYCLQGCNEAGNACQGTRPFCGDGILQEEIGEECDLGAENGEICRDATCPRGGCNQECKYQLNYGDTECSDRIDNDNDNRIDYQWSQGLRQNVGDLQCTNWEDNDELSAPVFGPTGQIIIYCGDGIVHTEGTSNPEECDEGHLNGMPGGTCTEECTLMTECNNRIDDDEDGRIDYPGDASCSSPQDDSEMGISVVSEGGTTVLSEIVSLCSTFKAESTCNSNDLCTWFNPGFGCQRPKCIIDASAITSTPPTPTPTTLTLTTTSEECTQSNILEDKTSFTFDVFTGESLYETKEEDEVIRPGVIIGTGKQAATISINPDNLEKTSTGSRFTIRILDEIFEIERENGPCSILIIEWTRPGESLIYPAEIIEQTSIGCEYDTLDPENFPKDTNTCANHQPRLKGGYACQGDNINCELRIPSETVQNILLFSKDPLRDDRPQCRNRFGVTDLNNGVGIESVTGRIGENLIQQKLKECNDVFEGIISEFEPNNDFDEANEYDLEIFPNVKLDGEIEESSSINVLIEGSSDIDIFKINKELSGEEYVTINVLTPRGSLDPLAAIFDLEEDLIYRNDDINRFSNFDSRVKIINDGNSRNGFYLAITDSQGNPSTGNYVAEFNVNENVPRFAQDKQVVFLNFDGAQELSIGGPPINFTAFDPEIHIDERYEGQREQMINLIFEKIQEDFADYNIEIITNEELLPEGEFSTIYFGGFHEKRLGVARSINFNNLDHSDNAIVYVETFSRYTYLDLSWEQMSNAIANTAAHEIGHLIGLSHTVDLEGVMDVVYSTVITGDQYFKRSHLTPGTFPIGHQNAPKTLEHILGKS